MFLKTVFIIKQLSKEVKNQLGVGSQICNPNTQEMKAGETYGQLEIHEILSLHPPHSPSKVKSSQLISQDNKTN